MSTTRPTLTKAEISLILNGLRAAYTFTLDAYGNCSGEPHYPDFKREKPNFEQMNRLVAHLNLIENLAIKLGYALDTNRRAIVEEYVAYEIEAWRESERIRDLAEV